MIALDPIQRGHVVRFEVIATSRVDVRSATARVLPTTGVQVIGRPFGEARIVRVARAYERVVDWASRAPAL